MAAFSLHHSKLLVMTPEQIERFVQTNSKKTICACKISFKARHAFEGIFITTPDSLELKKKNFWRIVATSRVEEYLQSKDINLSRIFNGSEFTRLATNS